MEDNDEENSDAVEKALDLDYHVAQAFYSHTVPKAVLLFTVEALDDSMDFEPKDGEGDDGENEEGYDKGG